MCALTWRGSVDYQTAPSGACAEETMTRIVRPTLAALVVGVLAGGCKSSGEERSTTAEMAQHGTSAGAACKIKHEERSLTIEVVGNGITDPAPGVHRYQKGTVVTVKAQPAKGSLARGWAGDASGTSKRLTIVMDEDKTVSALFTLASWPTGPAATYDNPVLPGDHPDLNVFMEGRSFYLVGSNFAMFPALEILHSTDLLHWDRVARVVDATSPALEGQTGPGQGTWGAFIVRAPRGYRVYFAINGTQWFAEANSLEGPWSQPVKVASVPVSPDGGVTYFDRGTGSDNSVFVDSDATTYMVTKNGLGKWGGNPSVSDFGMNRLVVIDPVTGQLVPESMIDLDFVNWFKDEGGGGPLNDNPDWSHWAEGPTMAKRGDWYYYFVQTHTACDGQTDVWASKTLDGDPAHWVWLGYVMGPGDPYNGTQHPSAPFQIADGTWWAFAHSYDCTDNLGNAEHHGEWMGLAREGLLHQVTWVDTTVGGQTIAVPHFTAATRGLPAPRLNQSRTPFLLPVNDDFSRPDLDTAWTTYDRMGSKLSVSDRRGWLRIKPDAGTTVWALQKEALRSTASLAKVEFAPAADGDAAGICVRNGFWNDEQVLSGPTWIEGQGFMVGIFDVSVARTQLAGADVVRFAFRKRTPVGTGGSGSYTALADPVVVSYTAPAPRQRAIWLKLVRSGHMATGWYSTDRVTWRQVGEAIDIEELDDNYGMSNAWVGNQAGMFATNKSADFDLFTYRDGHTDIPAVATDQQSGTAIVTSTDKGQVLGGLENGDWALYGSVDLGGAGVASTAAAIEASSAGGGYVEIWLDPLAGGPHFGPCPIADTADWESWQVSRCAVAASGTHDVYLKVVGKPGSELMRIASLRFVP
jgi:xylan 1,4-beta-xylosidase